MKNTLADHLTYLGHDIDFVPREECEPTDTWPGTRERIEVYRQRVVSGQPVFHRLDRTFEGAVGIQRPLNHGKQSPGRPPVHEMRVTRFANPCRVIRGLIK